MATVHFTDRYGGKGPPKNCCKGPCEGIGSYPDMRPGWKERYGSLDNVKFIKCKRCGGTGIEPKKRKKK